MVTAFFPLLAYGDISRCSRTDNSAVLDRIWLKCKLIQGVKVVLITCKNDEDQIKIESASDQGIIHQLLRHLMAANFEISNGTYCRASQE